MKPTLPLPLSASHNGRRGRTRASRGRGSALPLAEALVRARVANGEDYDSGTLGGEGRLRHDRFAREPAVRAGSPGAVWLLVPPGLWALDAVVGMASAGMRALCVRSSPAGMELADAGCGAPFLLRSTRATVSVVRRDLTQRELRNDSGEIMRALDAGESFVVTRNGVPVGELTPVRRRRFVGRDAAIAAFRVAAAVDLRRFRSDVDRYASEDPAPRA